MATLERRGFRRPRCPARLYTIGRANRASRPTCVLVETPSACKAAIVEGPRRPRVAVENLARRSRAPAAIAAMPCTPSAPALPRSAHRRRAISSVSNCPVPATYSRIRTIASRTTSSASASERRTSVSDAKRANEAQLYANSSHRPECRNRLCRAARSRIIVGEPRAKLENRALCGIVRARYVAGSAPKSLQSARMPACFPEQLL